VAVRRAAAQDAARLAELWLALHRHHAALDPCFELAPDAPEELRRLVAQLLADRDCAIFVAEEEGVARAFCAVRVERAPRLLVERARAEITELGVEPAWRRRGLGRALADAASRWAAERAARLEVRVAVRNPEGQAFWRALGYEGLVDVLQRRI
jgi:ribosomal protein S18 acetylase RimI-like enzyme